LSNKNILIDKYLDKFPNVANKTLASKIYNENKLLFKSAEVVRSAIRNRRGSNGAGSLKKLHSDKYLSPEKRILKYNLPTAIETDYQPYLIIGNRGLIFGDIHIPFHSVPALNTMFDYVSNLDFDFILLDGDVMDCFEVSNFNHEPDLVSFKEERDKTKEFIIELKRLYPKTKIYYKFGNHEKRFEIYLMSKAPEIFGLPEFRLDIILDLYNLGVEYIPEDRYIDLSGLHIIHGHEYKNAITSPANPARTTYLRAKDSALVAHYHQSSEHTEPSIGGKVVTCWSIGCMCELHPKYMPLNRWNHGFAIYEREDEKFWHVQNKRIIDNRVV